MLLDLLILLKNKKERDDKSHHRIEIINFYDRLISVINLFSNTFLLFPF